MEKTDIQQEVEENYEAFLQILPSLLLTHREQYALLKGKKVLGYYSNSADARTAAESFIPDKIYSIQKVTDLPIDLGYFSHALHRRTIRSSDRSANPTRDPTSA